MKTISQIDSENEVEREKLRGGGEAPLTTRLSNTAHDLASEASNAISKAHRDAIKASNDLAEKIRLKRADEDNEKQRETNRIKPTFSEPIKKTTDDHIKEFVSDTTDKVSAKAKEYGNKVNNIVSDNKILTGASAAALSGLGYLAYKKYKQKKAKI
jgi:hypothetical protein